MAKVNSKSKKTQRTRKGHRGQKNQGASRKKHGFSYKNIGLAVVALMLALAVTYVLRSTSKRAPMTSSPPPAENLDVWEWDKNAVAQWVRRQGKQYKRFATIFEKHELNGEQVLDLVEQDLEKLGLKKANARNKLMKLVKDLRNISGMEGVMTLEEAQRRDPHKTSGPENPDNTNFGATDKPSFCRLNRWLKANGADLHKVYLDPSQRILRVRRKISKGETILTLPPGLFMSTALSRTDSKIVQILEKEIELGTHSLISIYMLEEMKNKETTFWQPYIDVIPERYEDIPIFWSDAEVKELQGDALSRYTRRRETLKHDYDQICDHCPGFKDTATLEEFMWARTAVITRTFGLKVNGQKITSNLPIDFVMHANQPDTTWGYDQAKGVYHITAVRDIPKNKFLTITYGKKANARFLVNYGFCLPVNSRNKGHIFFDDANMYGREDVPANQRLEPEKFELEINDAKVDEVVKRCRMIVKDHCKRQNITDGWEVQKCAWEYLFTKCNETLSKFPTTVEYDFEQLKRDDLSTNVRNAIYARSGEKAVTDFYIRLAQGALDKLKAVNDATSKAQSEGASPEEIRKIRNTFAKEMFAYPRTFTMQNLIVDPEL
jgi:hypothetical protein